MGEFNYQIVKDPEVFRENVLPAHSDHMFYENVPGDCTTMLNGIWKFSWARNYESAPHDFYRDDVDCRAWGEIRVPGHIEMQGYGAPQYVNTEYPWDGIEETKPGEVPQKYNPTGSYVKYFVLPKGWEKRRVCISFQGVESGFALWLNGEYVGYGEDGFTPSEFDLTPYLRTGENKLAVQVFKWTSGSWCEDQDFFRFSGIFRDVYLYVLPKIHISDMLVRTVLNDSFDGADLEISLKSTAPGHVRIILSDGGRMILAKERALKNADTKKDSRNLYTFHVSPVKLWSAEIPHLYDLRIEVFDAFGTKRETVTEKVGFRRFEIVDSIMRLNGKRIVFNGVNRHEFCAESGRVIDADIIRRDLVTMKRNNINAVRTSHYPNRTEFYRMCDELGLYVIDETNHESHGVWEYLLRSGQDISFALPGDRPEYRELVLDRGKNMIQRDKNHPCVLIWSCGNESFGGSVLRDLSLYFRETDPTRPVHYEGITWDPRYPETSDMKSSMYASVQEIKEYLAEHRDKPYISCEYSHAMGNSCGALHKYTDLAAEETLYQGGFIWDYIDQTLTLRDRYGREYQGYGGDFGDRPTDFDFSGNGIAYGENREPSPKMQEVKYCYQNILVSFPDAGNGRMVVTNRNLFLGTDAFSCRAVLARNGVEIGAQDLAVAVGPLSEEVFPMPFRIPEEAGEYSVTVSFHLREDTAWAKAGHEVAYGQYVTRVGAEAEDGLYVTRVEAETEGVLHGTENAANRGPLNVIHGWQNIGVRGDSFQALFSITYGGLVSYKYAGREMLSRMPKPNFWRAMTQNDTANQLPFRAGQWKAAGMFASHHTEHGRGGTPPVVEELEDRVAITYTYHLPVKPSKDCTVRYEVYGDGEIAVTMRMDASDDVGELPEFSMLFAMDADYDRLTWYGLGPEETYADRCHAKLGIYSNLVAENMAKYIVPQECGNKMGVRWAKVADRNGRGLLFLADGLEFSALPYSPQELDYAMHPMELPLPHFTYVRVGRQMGVGGDDTWGALTHPEYLLDNSEALEIRFSFRGI